MRGRRRAAFRPFQRAPRRGGPACRGPCVRPAGKEGQGGGGTLMLALCMTPCQQRHRHAPTGCSHTPGAVDQLNECPASARPPPPRSPMQDGLDSRLAWRGRGRRLFHAKGVSQQRLYMQSYTMGNAIRINQCVILKPVGTPCSPHACEVATHVHACACAHCCGGGGTWGSACPRTCGGMRPRSSATCPSRPATARRPCPAA